MGPGIEPESFTKDSVELMFREMDEAGITKGVVVGRIRPNFVVTNDGIADLVNKHPDRLIGVAGVDVWNEYHQAVPEIERSIGELKLKGVAIEPGGNQRAMHFNDPRLHPIFAKCNELKVPVFVTTGPKQGPALNYTHPENLESVAKEFPDLKIVVVHGCYPYVMEMIAIAIRCPNLFFHSDIYTSWPGGDLYIKAAEKRIVNQFLFASAYPTSPFKEAIEGLRTFELGDEAMEKILYKNAQRLFGE
jgi:predicted TIM-barrel fold metal-dependent hydrolase